MHRTPDLFESGLHLTHELDTLFGLPNRTVLSLRDVPGLTRAAIPFLAKYGVKAVSVGVNTYSGPPAVARIFKWHDTASNTGVYGLCTCASSPPAVSPYVHVILC